MKEFILRIFDKILRQFGVLWGKKEEPMQRPAFQVPIAESDIKEGDDMWELYNHSPPEI